MNDPLIQPAAFLALAYGGILAGVVYDVFRLIRRFLSWRWMGALCDALFLVAAAALFAAALLGSTGGELRVYLVAGYLTGFLVQQWSVSALFFRLMHSILPH